MVIKSRLFDMHQNGIPIHLYSLRSGPLEVEITNYGCIITSIRFPDGKGKIEDVILGFDSLKDYLTPNPYLGCVVGRYANRIASGTFMLDGLRYQLTKNDGENHLHGGLRGFDKRVWDPSVKGDQLVLELVSPDGDEGYPGNLTTKVTYEVKLGRELSIEYEASTDKPTVVNLTNHSYFNLSGRDDVLDQELRIDADYYTPSGSDLIPKGEIQSLSRTPLDFREPNEIGLRINSDHDQLSFGGGYDHNYVLNGKVGTHRLIASLFDPSTGRAMDVLTTQPGLQFYTGNFLDGSLKGKGKVLSKRSGLCLETQHYPNSPNQSTFPSTVLRPDEVYKEKTTYRFRIER